jgi:hypothetical protein
VAIAPSQKTRRRRQVSDDSQTGRWRLCGSRFAAETALSA